MGAEINSSRVYGSSDFSIKTFLHAEPRVSLVKSNENDFLRHRSNHFLVRIDTSINLIHEKENFAVSSKNAINNTVSFN